MANMANPRGRPPAPPVVIRRWQPEGWSSVDDQVAAEEPLQLLLDGSPLSIVMRTPGEDLELALGLLWAERVITSATSIVGVHLSAESAPEDAGDLAVFFDLLESNQVDVRLGEGGGRRPERSFLASSACGVCGATTVAGLTLDFERLENGPAIDPALLPRLPEILRDGQRLFAQTGGLHAAGLFSLDGGLELVREDIGRHNAVDKLVGRLLIEGRLPAADRILVVSGRAGYELVQKAIAAGFPSLVAVGAPSSLAIRTAREFNLSLAGFTRADRFNVYSGAERFSSPTRTAAM